MVYVHSKSIIIIISIIYNHSKILQLIYSIISDYLIPTSVQFLSVKVVLVAIIFILIATSFFNIT